MAKKEGMTRQEALAILKCLNPKVRDAIALIVETADVQSDWAFNGDDSVSVDDVQGTLNTLASEIRNA